MIVFSYICRGEKVNYINARLDSAPITLVIMTATTVFTRYNLCCAMLALHIYFKSRYTDNKIFYLVLSAFILARTKIINLLLLYTTNPFHWCSCLNFLTILVVSTGVFVFVGGNIKLTFCFLIRHRLKGERYRHTSWNCI